ncbi:MAG: dual specificity protein phosphatase family protein [Nitrososphaeria archaeon]
MKEISVCQSNDLSFFKRAQLKASDLFRMVLSAVAGKPSNFSHFDGYVYASGIPYGKRAVRWIKKKGIEAVVNLTEKNLDYQGLENIHIPMKNGLPQKPEILHRAVLAVENYQKNKRKTLVHCSAGLGRTGMVLSCYLIYKYGINAENALRKLRELRKGSVSDRLQEECVYAYEKWLKEQVKGGDQVQ